MYTPGPKDSLDSLQCPAAIADPRPPPRYGRLPPAPRASEGTEPRRDSRRLRSLRGWSHGETKQVLPGTAGLDATVVVEQQNKHESPRAGDDDRRQLRMTPWARRAPESPVV